MDVRKQASRRAGATTFSTMTFGITTLSIITNKKATFSVITLNIMAEQCHLCQLSLMLSVTYEHFIPSVVMVNVVMLIVVMVSVVMLSIVMLSVVMPSVVMMNVVAPRKSECTMTKRLKNYFFRKF
jgi:hypothetical protein